MAQAMNQVGQRNQLRGPLFFGVAVAGLAVALWGCGDDDESNPDSGGMCQMPYVAPTVPTTAGCTGAADQTAVTRTDYQYVPPGSDLDGGTDAGSDAGAGDAGAGDAGAGDAGAGDAAAGDAGDGDAATGDAGGGTDAGSDAGTPSGIDFAVLSQTCAASECALSSDPQACMAACLGRSLAGDPAAPSAACQTCYVTSSLCAIQNCATLCIADPTATVCNTCICGKNVRNQDCIGDFEVCSGVDADRCDGLCLD